MPETIGGQTLLRWFGDNPGNTESGDMGRTKNGHSVVTILTYGEVRSLFGGGLNIPAEMYMLGQYGPETDAFRVDVTKACHHGSADFSTDFLERISPMVTVLSSGDDESHSHPRLTRSERLESTVVASDC